jgi:hypothetical protein
VAELPGAHDLGTDRSIELPREQVVDATASAGLPMLGGEQPFVKPIPGVTEMVVFTLTFTDAESIEGNSEVLNADE